jgi:hypothetical protein
VQAVFATMIAPELQAKIEAEQQALAPPLSGLHVQLPSSASSSSSSLAAGEGGAGAGGSSAAAAATHQSEVKQEQDDHIMGPDLASWMAGMDRPAGQDRWADHVLASDWSSFDAAASFDEAAALLHD